MISKEYLVEMYVTKRKSVALIAAELHCSQNKITYWLQKYKIQKRSISDAIYSMHNPHGDPFNFTTPTTAEDWFLYGLGLGLFWGEGNKVNKHSVRLGNTDPALIKVFITFLQQLYKINTK